MPISTMPSGSTFSHSWLRVYLRSAGILLINAIPPEHKSPQPLSASAAAAATKAGSGLRMDHGYSGITITAGSRSQRDHRPAVAHEWRPHGQRWQQPAAHLDLNRSSGRRRHARQTDGTRQRRRIRAAGDLALADTGHDDPLMAAQHGTLIQNQPDT